MKAHHLAWSGCRWLLRVAGMFALWTLWLGLSLLLATQIYIASTRTLELPRFVRRAIEERLAMSGVQATFGRTIFDPSGRVLIENVGIRLPGFEEKVITARAIYSRLDPWALAVGRFEPVELRVTGMSLRVPAMLSPSGRDDEIIHDLDGAFFPRGEELGIGYLTFRLGDVGIAARGALHLKRSSGEPIPPLPIADFFAHNYAALSREFADAIELFGVFDRPALQVELAPSESRGGIASLTLFARGLKLASPELRATNLQVTGELPFFSQAGEPVATEFTVAADELDLPHGVAAHRVQVRLEATFQPGRLQFRPSVITGMEFTAADVSAAGLTVQSPIVSLTAGPLPGLRANILAQFLGAPISVRSEMDIAARTANVRFDGGLSPGLLQPLGARLGRDLGKYVSFASPIAVNGEARFGAGWKFAGATARVAATRLTIRGVRLGQAAGRVEFDGHRLAASDLCVRIGDNSVRGSYEEDMATKDYRFVLAGRLRPLEIAPWFAPKGWWPQLFGNFAFPGTPPAESADVRSNWINGRKAVVFVAVDSPGVVYRGVPFDRVRTRLFIKPGLDDGLEFHVTRGSGSASGTFAIRRDLVTEILQGVDFEAASTLDIGPLANVFGPKVAPILEPFAFAVPPTLKGRGHFDGPAAPSPQHRILHVDVSSAGAFRYHEFPFERVSFSLDENDDRLSIQHVELGFAGGALTGQAKVWGAGPTQRLGFDAALKGASLGQAIASVRAFVAKRAKGPPPAITSFVKEKSNVRLDLSVSAEGACHDFLSYQGSGSAHVQGSELGEVRMFGLLSELLKFTMLHFTSAQADFTVAGPQLVFPAVTVTGANSGIQAHGTYNLANHDLDFKAKIFPFGKSKSLPGELMSGVLKPLSEIFEVKLTGTIEKPAWSF